MFQNLSKLFVLVILAAGITTGCEIDQRLADAEQKILALPEPDTHLADFEKNWKDAMEKHQAVKRDVLARAQRHDASPAKVARAIEELAEIQRLNMTYLLEAIKFYGDTARSNDRVIKSYLYANFLLPISLRCLLLDQELTEAEGRALSPEDRIDARAKFDERVATVMNMAAASKIDLAPVRVSLNPAQRKLLDEIRTLQTELQKALQSSGIARTALGREIPDITCGRGITGIKTKISKRIFRRNLVDEKSIHLDPGDEVLICDEVKGVTSMGAYVLWSENAEVILGRKTYIRVWPNEVIMEQTQERLRSLKSLK